MLEKHHTKESKRKINKNNTEKIERINQYDLDGNFINTWENSLDICKHYNYKTSAYIRKCCNYYLNPKKFMETNKRPVKSAYGYIWKFADVEQNRKEVDKMNKKINFKLRLKNPLFIASIIMSVLIPIVGYMGIGIENITSWQKLGEVIFEAVKNPYVLGIVTISVYNCCIDFTTKGLSDSEIVLKKSSFKDK